MILKADPITWEPDPYNPRRTLGYAWPFNFIITDLRSDEFPNDEPFGACFEYDCSDWWHDVDQWGDYTGGTLEETKAGVLRFVQEVLMGNFVEEPAT